MATQWALDDIDRLLTTHIIEMTGEPARADDPSADNRSLMNGGHDAGEPSEHVLKTGGATGPHSVKGLRRSAQPGYRFECPGSSSIASTLPVPHVALIFQHEEVAG